MIKRGYAPESAQRCFQQIEGFADYGFPESHSASFAPIVYAPAWLKCHYPAVFACALLNSQLMGLLRAGADHGERAGGTASRYGLLDINFSDRDCTEVPSARMEWTSPHPTHLPTGEGAEGEGLGAGAMSPTRLSLCASVGADRLAKQHADVIAAARSWLPLSRRSRAPRGALPAGAGDAGRGGRVRFVPGLDRRRALWQIRGLDPAPLPLFAPTGWKPSGSRLMLPTAPLGEQVADDYRMLRLSLKVHPVRLLAPASRAMAISSRRSSNCRALAGQGGGGSGHTTAAGQLTVSSSSRSRTRPETPT